MTVVRRGSSGVAEFYGLAADVKPVLTAGQAGSVFFESDTGIMYRWSGSTWFAANVISGTAVIGGNVANNGADSGNPIKTGGVYNVAAPTLDSGDRGDTQLDVNGNTKVVLGAEEVRSFMHNLGTDVDVSVKVTSGFLLSVICGNQNAAVRYFQVHNLAAAPGAAAVPIASWPIRAGDTLILGADELGTGGMQLSTGIAVGVSTVVGSHTAATVAEHAWSVSYV